MYRLDGAGPAPRRPHVGPEPPGPGALRGLLVRARGRPGGRRLGPRPRGRLVGPLLPRRRLHGRPGDDARGDVPRPLRQGRRPQQRRPPDAQPLVAAPPAGLQPLVGHRHPVPPRRRHRLRVAAHREARRGPGDRGRRVHLAGRPPRGAQLRRPPPAAGDLPHPEQPVRHLGAGRRRGGRRPGRAGPGLRDGGRAPSTATTSSRCTATVSRGGRRGPGPARAHPSSRPAPTATTPTPPTTTTASTARPRRWTSGGGATPSPSSASTWWRAACSPRPQEEAVDEEASAAVARPWTAAEAAPDPTDALALVYARPLRNLQPAERPGGRPRPATRSTWSPPSTRPSTRSWPTTPRPWCSARTWPTPRAACSRPRWASPTPTGPSAASTRPLAESLDRRHRHRHGRRRGPAHRRDPVRRLHPPRLQPDRLRGRPPALPLRRRLVVPAGDPGPLRRRASTGRSTTASRSRASTPTCPGSRW